jgi:thioredoxin reductase
VAAAIQLKRSGVPVMLFEKGAVGGLLHNANLVENYPGIPGGLPGPSFCRRLEQHLESAGVVPVRDEVTSIEAGFVLKTGSKGTVQARAVIVATGTVPTRGILEEEASLLGKRIFFEVWDVLCSAKGRRAAILGGGDAAYDYALNLASKGYTVRVLQRGPARCLPLLEERARDHDAITIVHGVNGIALRNEEKMLGIELEGERLDVDFLLVACGRSPADRLLPETNPPGLFTGGDLVRGSLRQAGIAVGDGLAAAMKAARYVKGLDLHGTHP